MYRALLAARSPPTVINCCEAHSYPTVLHLISSRASSSTIYVIMMSRSAISSCTASQGFQRNTVSILNVTTGGDVGPLWGRVRINCILVRWRIWSRNSSGVDTIFIWIIWSATRRAATAVLRQTFRTRNDSIISLRVFGVTVRMREKAVTSRTSPPALWR